MSVWRVCPLCSSVNAEQATQCDCGFEFRKERKPNPACPDLPDRFAEWKLEPELVGPIPRRMVPRFDYLATAILLAVAFLGLEVWFYGTEIADYAWLFLIALGVMAITYYAGQQDRWLSSLLVSTGTVTRGVIVECTCFTGVRGQDHWQGVIAYETPARRNIKVGLDRRRKVGEAITVLYMPEAPDLAMPYERCFYKAVSPEKVKST